MKILRLCQRVSILVEIRDWSGNNDIYKNTENSQLLEWICDWFVTWVWHLICPTTWKSISWLFPIRFCENGPGINLSKGANIPAFHLKINSISLSAND